MKNKEPESSPLPSKVEEITGSFYKPIAALVTTYQMSVEDWDLGPMSKKNRREIYNRVERHNDNLRNVAIELKNQFESLKAKSPDSPLPSKVDDAHVESQEEVLQELFASYRKWLKSRKAFETFLEEQLDKYCLSRKEESLKK